MISIKTPTDIKDIARGAVLLGTGDDNLTITTTITGTSDINAGNGNNTVTVDNTQGPLNLTTGTGYFVLTAVGQSGIAMMAQTDGIAVRSPIVQ